MENVRLLADKYADYICDIRHDLHAHPEASMEEFRTTDVIAKELDKMGIPYRRFEPTGLIAKLLVVTLVKQSVYVVILTLYLLQKKQMYHSNLKMMDLCMPVVMILTHQCYLEPLKF